MRKRVKLGMEALEAREVPAAFSFQLSDGRAGAGTFSTPAGVDPAAATQAIALSDLAVSIDGTVYEVQGSATATYAYGVLAGVAATAEGTPGGGPLAPAEVLTLSGAVAAVGADAATPIDSAAVAYDTADTQATFELSDGTAGALSYDINWDAVDPGLANQSLSLSNFVLNIAGKNLTPATATFTTSPTAQFQYGELVGLTFAINTATLTGFPYTAVSMSGMAVAAQTLGGQTATATAAIGRNTVTLNFTEVTTGQAYSFHLKLLNGDGGEMEFLDIDVGANASPTQIMNTIAEALEGTDFKVKIVGNTLTISASRDTGFAKLEYKTFKPDGTADATLKGPTFISGRGVQAKVNGTVLNP